MAADETPGEGYVTEVNRVRRWRWEASVFVVGPAGSGAVAHLVTLRAPTRRSALRRAARFLDLRQRLEQPR